MQIQHRLFPTESLTHQEQYIYVHTYTYIWSLFRSDVPHYKHSINVNGYWWMCILLHVTRYLKTVLLFCSGTCSIHLLGSAPHHFFLAPNHQIKEQTPELSPQRLERRGNTPYWKILKWATVKNWQFYVRVSKIPDQSCSRVLDLQNRSSTGLKGKSRHTQDSGTGSFTWINSVS